MQTCLFSWVACFCKSYHSISTPNCKMFENNFWECILYNDWGRGHFASAHTYCSNIIFQEAFAKFDTKRRGLVSTKVKSNQWEIYLGVTFVKERLGVTFVKVHLGVKFRCWVTSCVRLGSTRPRRNCRWGNKSITMQDITKANNEYHITNACYQKSGAYDLSKSCSLVWILSWLLTWVLTSWKSRVY